MRGGPQIQQEDMRAGPGRQEVLKGCDRSPQKATTGGPRRRSFRRRGGRGWISQKDVLSNQRGQEVLRGSYKKVMRKSCERRSSKNSQEKVLKGGPERT